MGTSGARTGDERAGSGAEHGAGRVAGAALLLRGSRFGAGAGWRTRARVGYRPIPQSALPGLGRGPDALLLSGVGSAGSAGPGAGCGLGLRLGGVPDAVLGDLTEVEACFADVQRAGPPLPVAWHPAQSRAHRALTPGGWCLCETCARVLQLHPEDRGGRARTGRPSTGGRRGLRTGRRVCDVPPSSYGRAASPSHVSGRVLVGESAQGRGRRPVPWQAGVPGEPGLGSRSLPAPWHPVILHSESLAVCGLGAARRAWTGGGRREISREARPEAARPGGRAGDTPRRGTEAEGAGRQESATGRPSGGEDTRGLCRVCRGTRSPSEACDRAPRIQEAAGLRARGVGVRAGLACRPFFFFPP